MEYDLSSRKLESSVDNVGHRSVYGDMHATRDTLMIAEHVAFLRQYGMIEPKMALELSKPFYRDRNYTKAYLKTHPNYTGVQPEMSSFTTAERHQKKRDQKMEKFVEDYEAVRIDEDGNPIALEGAGVVQGAAVDVLSRSDDDSSDEPANPPRSILPIRRRKLLRESTSAMTAAPKPEPEPAPVQSSSSPPPVATATPPLKLSPKPTPRGVKRKYRVEPLQPLPGGEDYSRYKYYQLLAVCRKRQIYSTGDTQEVRNCLIQDDINIAQDLPRNIAKHKTRLDKHFLHKVPEALKRGSGNR